jgi:hypothetical protein
MFHFLFCLLWLVLPSHANPVSEAEYIRLQTEMRSFAKRNAWKGVEHSFQSCAEIKPTLEFDDYLLGAFAAQSSGDVKATRARLWAAHQLKEDKSVLDWLWNIDTTYVQVHIQAKPEDKLTYVGSDFYPQLPKMLQHAQKAFASGDGFNGYLLPGTYEIGALTFDVDFNTPKTRIDTRISDLSYSARRISLR